MTTTATNTDYAWADSYNEAFTPQAGTNYNGLESIADGDYDCTILTAKFDTTKNGMKILKLEVRFDALGKVAEKPYFFENADNVNRWGGDMATLGFPAGEWGKKVPLSQAFPLAIAGLPGKRFKGSKKASQSKDGQKTYHNLYVNAPLSANGSAVAPVAYSSPADEADIF